ncbi:hypothetical protein K493DRAFT_282785 [Basidiobolus meristosporus CBS 931.73]|uniref:Uncharacterized protein n=1 Tax=Basidiobolus meristosporus CBS 931.73 TaxID=1314790 RepID=A0A1Y1YBT3_9FUNG|nr:hypothetical protein K493DRAFT_282785 [Basidiobolus meristosporus CBS 931.73]|eukprot:ORX95459.1 hypothetical protein K493DRAFT_282785 [Basidiobolus meristosporus CBS 931.73]
MLSSTTRVGQIFKTMVDLLVQEEIRTEEGATGACMEYLLKNHVLGKLAHHAPDGIRQEVIRFISSMINLLDDRFLVHKAAHVPTLKLLEDCMGNEEWRECFAEDLVDLMYNICSKIHGYPELLHIFFYDKQWLTAPQKSNARGVQGQNKLFNAESLKNLVSNQEISNEGEKREYEFAFFKHLLLFIHKDGKLGDVARTALLFLMDVADSGLRDFILTGDFCTIIAAGLGAFYSQLPRKLVVEASMESVSFGYHGYPTEKTQRGETATSPEFQALLESFLKYLDFTQEVLVRCSRGSICTLLLDSTKSLFVENILYPSLLECSDTDGTAIAVITYIDLLIRHIKNSELNNMIVAYLVNSDLTNMPSHSTSGLRGISNGDTDVDAPTKQLEAPPLLPYNMKDLIFSNLRSTSQPVVIAALKLLKTMLTHHCLYTVSFLDVEYTSTREKPTDERRYTPAIDHLRVLSKYLSLISLIDPTHEKGLSAKSYGEYLADAEVSMEYHEHHHMDDMAHMKLGVLTKKSNPRRHTRAMSIKYSNLDATKNTFTEEQPKKIPSGLLQNLNRCTLFKHKIRPTDPIMHVLIGLLSGYFEQSCELNLAVTGVLTAVISCPCRDLESWVSSKNETLIPPNHPHGRHSPVSSDSNNQEEYGISPPSLIYDDESSEDEMDPSAQDETCFKSRLFEDPIFFAVLEELSNQVVRYRREMLGFDQRFRARREELLSFGIQPARRAFHVSEEGRFNSKRRSLEEMVDNAIILGEVIKEVVSIVQVRRSLGVNEVWYV